MGDHQGTTFGVELRFDMRIKLPPLGGCSLQGAAPWPLAPSPWIRYRTITKEPENYIRERLTFCFSCETRILEWNSFVSWLSPVLVVQVLLLYMLVRLWQEQKVFPAVELNSDSSARRKTATRSSAQGNCSEKSLAVSVILSTLPCSSILPCPPCLPPVMLSIGEGGSSSRGGLVCVRGSGRRRGSSGGGGSGRGEGGRGHSSLAAIYCTTTWCFALKGLRTMRVPSSVRAA